MKEKVTKIIVVIVFLLSVSAFLERDTKAVSDLPQSNEIFSLFNLDNCSETKKYIKTEINQISRLLNELEVLTSDLKADEDITLEQLKAVNAIKSRMKDIEKKIEFIRKELNR
ncbi:hypothetical protein AWH56_018240 [Anaerobacillus isosaccharinicus]|uniref:Uncharacterized protein n=1 Tax=Anaerobacillus isosaccharinicus TaxID=1532552 RepID=A0A1S2LE81_9BACI|nr:hypothetical protein [Anaerobacillus isosaccharinicus]MBA5587154.1 hypothetical protein [Anaerobacillus isosaccharinicus]QOY34649.1 hypothetical protein AWH56_018240 [Anaerobacillus isosaccharinicus]